MAKTESNDQSSEKVDRRTAAGRRINQLLDERKELRKQTEAQGQRIAELESALASVQADPNMPANVIAQRAQEMMHNELLRRDVHALRGKIAEKLKGRTPHPDAKKAGIPLHIVILLARHPDGADVGAHFLTNPQALADILGKPPGHHAAEVGALAERLRNPKVATTKTPVPVGGVNSKGHAVVPDASDPNMSFQDYKRLRSEGKI